jgi:transaldolase
MATRLQELQDCGQSPWIDFITRGFVNDGGLERLIRDGVLGVTSNPTIFGKAIADGDDYDQQLRRLADRDMDPYQVFIELARDDIRGACDLLAGAHTLHSGRIRDGWVSLEVDPRLAHDADRTLAEARHLHEVVDRSNLMVKIPGTEEGLTAIEDTIALGIPVNVTLLFSLQRHRQAAEAYVRGVRRLYAHGADLTAVASVASFFVSRVDTETDRRLDELGGYDDLKGELAIANAKLAYQTYLDVFSGEEWEELAADGASPQRCLWASTSAKNPAYRDVAYVEELIGPETVNTMPPDTIAAFEDHGHVGRTLDRDVDGAHRTFDAISRAGIDYGDVVATLEREGVDKFAESFDQMIEEIAAQLQAAIA